MIAVDSSAIVAVVESEPEAKAFTAIISSQDRCLISALNVLETAIVLRARRGRPGLEWLWDYLAGNPFQIVPFDDAQMRAAIRAFERYGKGMHPRARLNLADCAAYALARTMDLPLLFKGDDFSQTDVRRRL